MDVGRDTRISNDTITALQAVLAEESEDRHLFYAWKIHNEVENRVWLSLSDDVAMEWDSIAGGHVTIVAWSCTNLR